ncbi:tRNA (adenine-N(1)-)-methyltransferase catalytic subunit trm61 [Teratosphaeriaceae sp. CCFEE 6253]|nr:tRNA (adenine-N(1)-)-methyltransferase catalytic subunit trm61 [Teratosphaeriaceae sp. CCFEE 6253]
MAVSGPLESGAGSRSHDPVVAAATRKTMSPFFFTSPKAEDGGMAMLHLKRDSLMPVMLSSVGDEGYGTDCAVTNTRFGSFPHNTLIGLEWGSQVRASKVDTGSRGRKGKNGKPKAVDAGAGAEEMVVSRKRGADEAGMDETAGVAKRARHDAAVQQPNVAAGGEERRADETATNQAPAKKEAKRQQTQPLNDEHDNTRTIKAPVEAGSGFVHLLPPTPETWTSSLDHRTQVVYTPDYSYILQRLRVKPGSRMIEAGAGSGSFTHAAARAVFSGYPDPARRKRRTGMVYSYEYHEPRVGVLRDELRSHGLDGVVQLTHRDVCADGFGELDSDTASPCANAVFFDLPAPWKALKHLLRTSSPSSPSPLDPGTAVHLCSFSPCIEQVTATVSQLRRLGWTDIGMVEVANRRIDVRREQVGLRNEGLRGVNASPATVEEAVGRLREVEGGMAGFHANVRGAGKEQGKTVQYSKEDWPVPGEKAGAGGNDGAAAANGNPAKGGINGKAKPAKGQSKADRLAKIKEEAESRKLYREGNLVHRTEPEVKTHTSYLVFAVLPREWSEEDERLCAEEWAIGDVMGTTEAPAPGKDAQMGDGKA